MNKFKFLLLTLVAATTVSGCSMLGGSGEDDSNLMAIPSAMAGESMIGYSSTKLYDKDGNRLHNIALAIKSIDGKELKAGEEFSFNGFVGERSAETGYKEATALLGKKKIKEYGGGVCQLSTTMYQAAKSAELSITERHEHQKKIDYAKKGEDATVDYGGFDLKFKNTTEHSIKLNASMDENYVHVTIDKI